MELPLTDVNLLKPISVELDASIGEVRRIMRDSGARVVVVVGIEGTLLGVIYRSSILRFTSSKSNATARDIMEDPRVFFTLSTKLSHAVRLMLKYDEWYAPVVDNSMTLLGILGLEIPINILVRTGAYRGIRISDIMTRDVEYVLEGESLTRVWEIMVEKRYAGVPVTDSKGVLRGIVTQYDLIKRGYTRIELESEGSPPRRVKVSSAMNRSVEYLTPEDTAERAAELMLYRGYGRIPVVSSRAERVLMGIVDREDLLKPYFKLEIH
ncbi:MAG: CBS domain-containing protein [Aeropyrum sp.]|nr:CBS domain-containing protein [Aeropyrum sp.]